MSARARLLTISVGMAAALAVVLPMRPAAAVSASPSPVAPPHHLHTYGEQVGANQPDAPNAGSLAAELPLAGPYSYWNWPTGPERTSFSEGITVEHTTTPGASFFWSYQFSTPVDGGYIGLQDHSNTGHKIVLFSIWQGDAAFGTNCSPFDGEGSGYTCRLDPYNWVADRKYVVTVARLGTDPTGTWYVGSVLDTVTNSTQYVGAIHQPSGNEQPGVPFEGWVSWTEYFGVRPERCQDMPRARVIFDFPTANNGTVPISGHTNETDPNAPPGACKAVFHEGPELPAALRQSFPK